MIQKSHETMGHRIINNFETALNLHNHQMITDRSFRIPSDVVGQGSVTKGQTRKRTLRGKWKSVFSGRHIDNVSKETRVVSVTTQDSGNRGNCQRRKGRSSSLASHSKAKQTDGD